MTSIDGYLDEIRRGVRGMDPQIQRDILPLAALYAVEVNAVGLHLVFADNMIAAIRHVQLHVCRPEGEHHERESQQELPHMPVDYCTAGPGFTRSVKNLRTRSSICAYAEFAAIIAA